MNTNMNMSSKPTASRTTNGIRGLRALIATVVVAAGLGAMPARDAAAGGLVIEFGHGGHSYHGRHRNGYRHGYRHGRRHDYRHGYRHGRRHDYRHGYRHGRRHDHRRGHRHGRRHHHDYYRPHRQFGHYPRPHGHGGFARPRHSVPWTTHGDHGRNRHDAPRYRSSERRHDGERNAGRRETPRQAHDRRMGRHANNHVLRRPHAKRRKEEQGHN
ncbi:MAG: hypothetical protein ACR2RL_22905 [Gammaproteobacteria bacterium]